MKILLLNPPSAENTEYIRLERCMQKNSAWGGSLWQPLPLMYAQAMLKKYGYETKLKDATAERMSYQEAIDFVIREKPDFLIMNIAIPTIEYDSELASEIKKMIKKMKIIAVGSPTILISSIVADYGFDYAILGDVEYTVIDIVSGNDQVIKRIKNTKFVEHYVKDINKLPFPDLDDLDLDRYTVPFTREKLMLISLERGCPFNCSFCIVPIISKGKVRFRNANNFVDQIERDYKKYGIKNFLFWSEIATLDRKLMLSVCDEIIRRRLKIKWMTASRVDKIDQELLNRMRKAGCWLISYGIESTDQKILNSMKKGTTVKKVEEAVTMTHEADIKVAAHVIIGLPGDTKESNKKTVEWLIKNNIDYAHFYCAVPYWKTDLRKIAEKNNWIETNDPSRYEKDKAVMRNENLSKKEIENLRKKSYFKFYFRPRFIIKEMLNYKFNPLYIIYLIKDGFHFFKSWVL